MIGQGCHVYLYVNEVEYLHALYESLRVLVCFDIRCVVLLPRHSGYPFQHDEFQKRLYLYEVNAFRKAILF